MGMEQIYAELPKHGTKFYWLVGRLIFRINGAMNFIHVLVFFISISTGPTYPGLNKYGSGASWVLYGAASEQKAREWAQAKFDKMHEKDNVPQTIKEFLVLPFSDTLYKEKGSEPVPWTSLPSMRDQTWSDSREQEFYASGVIQAPNKAQGKNEEMKDMTLEKLRAFVDKQTKGPVLWNWDESQSWYYIFYTAHQATLVNSVNQVAAAIPYVKAVHGTPVGDEGARIEAWQGLTKYNE
jgi:hypothetical protein